LADTEVLARDKAVTSPSLPGPYPLVPHRGRRASVEDVEGNVFLDFNAGIARIVAMTSSRLLRVRVPPGHGVPAFGDVVQSGQRRFEVRDQR
jgi:hypothetical protein